MTNEEKILARLEELTEELRETKRAVLPYMELQSNMAELFQDMLQTALAGPVGGDTRRPGEALGLVLGQTLASADSVTEGLRMLNRFVEFKKDFEPYSKDIFHETVMFLQETSRGFEPQALSRLLQEFVSNIGNLADALRMLGSFMEFRHDAATLAKPAFDEAVARLEELKRKGVFAAFEQVLAITERIGTRLGAVDFTKAQPVRGVFGMMAALRRPEVQEGLGVLVELATVMAALKEPPQAAPAG